MKLSAAAALLLLSSQAHAATKVRLSNQPATYWGLPPFIAQQEGYYADQDLEVTFVTYPSGAPQINDPDSWDMGATGSVPCILAASLGIDTIGVSNDESQANALVATNPPNGTIDFTNQTIYVSPGSTGLYAVEACVLRAGSDVNDPIYADAQQGAILDALETQTAPVYGGLWAPNTYRFLENPSVDDPQILCTGKEAGAIVPGGIIVKKSYGEANPKIVAKVLACWLRAIEYIKKPANREQVITYLTEFNAGFNVSISRTAMEQEIDTRPLFNLVEQLGLYSSDTVANWFQGIALFLQKANGLPNGVPNVDTYLNWTYLQMVDDDSELQAFARMMDGDDDDDDDDDDTSSAPFRLMGLLSIPMMVAAVGSLLL